MLEERRIPNKEELRELMGTLPSEVSLLYKCALAIASIFRAMGKEVGSTKTADGAKLASLFVKILMEDRTPANPKAAMAQLVQLMLEPGFDGAVLICDKKTEKATVMASFLRMQMETPLPFGLTEKDWPKTPGIKVLSAPDTESYILYPHSGLCLCAIPDGPAADCPACQGTGTAKSLFGHNQVSKTFSEVMREIMGSLEKAWEQKVAAVQEATT